MRLRIVTYNIHRAIGVDRRFRPERIAAILAHHAADIVLLQEVDDGAPRSRELNLARELAQDLGYPHFAIGHNVTLRKGRYGNATLSRFPIRRETNLDLTIDSSRLGSLIRRGCQHTTLALPDDGELEVFNLHLGLSAREREQQIGLLVRSEEFRRVEPAVPLLVGGDFNDWRSRLRPIFTEVFDFTSATDRKGGLGGALRTYPSFSPQGGLDRLYFRGTMALINARSCRLQASRVASDHLPVIADFEVG